jgi:hypothetical protein
MPMPIPPRHLRLMILRQEHRRRQREQEVIMAAVVLDEHRLRRRRTMWVRPWLLRRPQLGQYDTLMQELMHESPADFKAFLRIEPSMFHELVRRVGPRITKNIERRPPLEAGLKLAITLPFLATGNSYSSLAFDFRVAHNTISLFVPEVCDAIVDEYKDEVFQTPSTPDAWMEVEKRFSERWNFHHTCGAIDGKQRTSLVVSSLTTRASSL